MKGPLTTLLLILSLLLGLALRQEPLFAAGATPVFAPQTVTNTADDGPGSLRQAIASASSGDTIDFALSGCPCTITLLTGELLIGKTLTIDGPGAGQLTISGNNASRVFHILSGNTVTLEGLTVSGGNSLSLDGGGIFNHGGTLTVASSVVSGNGGGGGIASYPTGSTLTLIASTVSGNSSDKSGGGIFSSGTLTLINSTISGNSTTTDVNGGGGIYNDGTMTVTNSTITGNRADSDGSGSGSGGGIFAIGTEALNNTIVAGNFRGVGTTPDDLGGAIETAGNNLIGDAASSAGITNGVNGNKVGNSGAGTIDINTVLETMLTANGGPTKTHLLVTNSPAIDAGSNALALDAEGQTLTTDQRGAGFPRLSGGTVDIGAFEVLVYTFCPAGKYDNGSGCVEASPGHYVPTAGATTQTACELGKYQPNSGATGCLSAAAGNYVNTTGAIEQTQCALGTYQPNTGAASCPLAAAGHFVNQPGSTAQTACQAGYYQPNTGSVSCIAASAGYYVPAPASISQIICPTGTTSQTAATSCTPTIYNFVGFFQPIDNAPAVNAANAGSSIPIKFSLTGYQGMAIFAAGFPASQSIACGSGALGTIEEIAAPGSSGLSYDATNDQYKYVWKTEKAWKGTCRKLVLKFSDGSIREALFQFK